MPKRGPSWTPKLSYHAPRQCGRVRIPGKGTVYLGTAGCWPDKRHKPPRMVREAYDREIATWLRHRGEDGQGTVPQAGLTVAELVEAFRRHCEKWYRKRGKPSGTVKLFRRACREVRQLHGSLPAEDFRPSHLRLVRDRLVGLGTVNRVTINRMLGRIRQMFAWAVEEELVSEEAELRLRTVKGIPQGRTEVREGGSVEPVSEATVAATLPHLPPTIADMVRVQQLAGMRPAEVCGMRLEDLAEEKDLLVYRVSEDWNKLAHKGQQRVVYLGPRAQAILRPYLEAARDRGDGIVWPKQRGSGAYSPDHYGRMIRRVCRRQGIERWSVNQLRHLRASTMRPIFGLEGVQAELGHATVEHSQVYAQRLEELARRMAREQG